MHAHRQHGRMTPDNATHTGCTKATARATRHPPSRNTHHDTHADRLPTNAPARQILLEAVEVRRAKRVQLIAAKVGSDAVQRLHAAGQVNWSHCNLHVNDAMSLAGLCVWQPAAVQAQTLRLDLGIAGGAAGMYQSVSAQPESCT